MSTQVVPIVRVADGAASVEWQRRVGFEQVIEHRVTEEMPADG